MPSILVVGATGQQGGGVLDALLNRELPDIEIRAMTRSRNSASAKQIRARGVTVVEGDLMNEESLTRVLSGCDAAYFVTDFRNPDDIPGELRQGRNFIDSAKKANVKHVVFSSVAGVDIAKEVEHFYSKYKIEQYLHGCGLSWTVIRPVGLMEVIPSPGIARSFLMGSMVAIFGTTKQRWIACEDVGKAVATALIQPKKFNGKTFTIAGDLADMEQTRKALERGEGSGYWSVWLPRWLVMLGSPYHYKKMFQVSSLALLKQGMADHMQWLSEGKQPGDVEETRQLVPDLLDLESWARKQSQRRYHAGKSV